MPYLLIVLAPALLLNQASAIVHQRSGSNQQRSQLLGALPPDESSHRGGGGCGGGPGLLAALADPPEEENSDEANVPCSGGDGLAAERKPGRRRGHTPPSQSSGIGKDSEDSGESFPFAPGQGGPGAPVLAGNRTLKSIIWLHLHNVAGTYMCQEARKQGETTAENNCDIRKDICSAKSSRRVHCDARKGFGYSFSAIEREVVDEDLVCNGVAYGVMLRDPLANARSTFVNNNFDEKDKKKIIHALQSGTPAQPGWRHKCLPDWDTVQHFDNFATRTLSGHYDAWPGRVTRADLERAKARLKRMDVVLILETLKDHLPQLQASFGWDVAPLLTAQRRNTHAINDLEKAFNKSEASLIQEHSALDYELFEFAKTVAADRTAAALAVMRGI